MVVASLVMLGLVADTLHPQRLNACLLPPWQSLEEAGIPCTKELEECFRGLGDDGAGNVSFTEFMSFWKQNLQHRNPRRDGSVSPPGDTVLRESVNGSAIFMRKYSYAQSVAENHAVSSSKRRMQLEV